MDAIDRIRAFNRRYTARMGLLSRSYLDSGLSLTEVRVLYELADRSGLSARDLATGLDLDEGYLSRLLDRFARRGWIARRPDAADARRRRLGLTAEGEAVLAPLADRSRADLTARLAGASPAALDSAAASLERAEAALFPDPGAVVLRNLRTGDAGWLIERHATLYARDEGFDRSFEALVAELLAAFIRRHDPATERAFIAEQDGRRLGSIFCVQSGEPGIAKLRLFLLVPEARGLGLGQRLLEACMGFAREAGYRRMRLWTHESHAAACALYRKAGFTLTRSEPVRSFGVDLVEQGWEIAL